MKYQLRAISRHRFSFLLTVLAATIAIAGAFASVRLQRALQEGAPAGTTIFGEPVSIFQHANTNAMDFFLSPRQVMEIDAHFAESGDVIASSGARLVDVSVDAEGYSTAVDFVSPNFFRSLGIKADDGGQIVDLLPNQVVISEVLLAKFGGTRPKTILIANRPLEIVAVAKTFAGLWDHETEIWAHWRNAEGVLLPRARDPGKRDVAFERSWFYWTLALPAKEKGAEFHARLKSLEGRNDVAESPFDKLRAIPGVSNQLELRDDAETNLTLYRSGTAMLLLTALLGLSAWSALTRIERIGDERMFTLLGMQRSMRAQLLLGSVLPPIIIAAALAAVVEPYAYQFVSGDATISALLEWTADLTTPYLWPERVAILLLALLTSLALNHMMARSASETNGTRTSMAGKRIGHGFNALMFVLCANAAGSGVLAFSVAAWHAKQRQADDHDLSGVHALQISKSRRAVESPIADRTWRETLRLELPNVLPSTSSVGFMSPRPYSGARPVLDTLQSASGQVQAMRVETDAAALDALGLKLLAGSTIGSDPFETQWVVDRALARQISGSEKPGAAVGRRIRDMSNNEFAVVGVVETIPYRTDLSQSVPVYYAPLSPAPTGLSVVIRRAKGAAPLNVFIPEASGLEISGGALRAAVSLEQRALESIGKRNARVTLTLVTCMTTLIVSMFVLVAITRVQVQRQRQVLAIRAALGATKTRMASAVFRSSALAWIVGSILGATVSAFMTRSLPGFWVSASHAWAIGALAVTLTLACAIFVAWRNLASVINTESLRELMQ